MGSARYRVALVSQQAWDTEQLSMPLALGYLKAVVLADDVLREHFEVEIYTYGRRASVSRMAVDVLEEPPDILAFSVLGWNYRSFGQLAEAYAQVRPAGGWCVLGGNHVTRRAARTCAMYPAVDLVVNGEGEQTFRELLLAFLAGKKEHELADIAGLSIRCADGRIIDTPDRPRLRDLDALPSPFLTGALPMRDASGRFPYDMALMETNRGCPYKCAFCYWGGAVGQKIARFSRERVWQELDFLAAHDVENLALCDANFGMLEEDLAFVERLIELRGRTGFPRGFVTSWAKNKSDIFFEIVQRLKTSGFHSDFTLSLQTLSDEALSLMRRKNMKLNDFEDLCRWLETEGMTAHVELIWGLPGETCESFIEGYDRIAAWHPRIATYPLLILPNTAFFADRQEHGLVTVRDTESDFELVLAHKTISMQDNRRMWRFLFWARLAAEYQIFRHIWRPLAKLAGMKQSEVIKSLDAWFSASEDPIAQGLVGYQRGVVDNLDVAGMAAAVSYVHTNTLALERVFADWWRACIAPRVPDEHRSLLDEIYRYDRASRPRYDRVAAADGLGEVTIDGRAFHGPLTESFSHQLLSVTASLRAEVVPPIVPSPWTAELYFAKGFDRVADSHELVPLYAGQTRAEIEARAQLGRGGRGVPLLRDRGESTVVGF